ncbi:hypothetical protein [Mycoplasmopsis bovis]|uniref:Uncharacterized protein n=2 Tax=Mycoplasmopsis bovis TaxID=28903 RepID=A0A454AQQ6_MYCBG|nr:hypothetical protein [Mycoplasmopsis bovis]ADR25396.1 conserved hypothetical protein (ICEB-1 encoded) [Mycoplasmopsis bovis PG45]MBT1317897.1 hypothetical protein [Mycoplasmopsis bovis]MBT1322194.1 hypothetical protein [Mycoplasmopsis bovis]MBT1325139.1 hypothetical protein [Mycoplasmopsis bovis]MBT1334958.1 hypothetical protein [Mycoplasmopsis bovis]
MDSNGEWFLFLHILKEAVHFFLYLKEKEEAVTIGQKLLEVDKWIETNKETFFIPKGYSKEKWIKELRTWIKESIEEDKEGDNEYEKRR